MPEPINFKEALFNLCEKIYCPSGSNFGQEKLRDSKEGVIDFARKNRLAHYLALEYPSLNLKELISEYESYKKRLVNSLGWLKKLLGKEKFLVIKTFSSFPHLTSDLDVLLKDTKLITEFRKEAGKLKNDNFLPVDISAEVSWGGAQPVSNNFIWNNARDFSFEGIEMLIPNPVSDTLLRLAHIPFELAQIKLGELLHMYRQISLLDKALLRDEAIKMKWPRTFTRMWQLFESLHYSLYKIPLSAGTEPVKKIAVLIFPFELPYFFLTKAVAEKRAWAKLLGARFIVKDRVAEWLKRSLR